MAVVSAALKPELLPRFSGSMAINWMGMGWGEEGRKAERRAIKVLIVQLLNV